MRSGEQKHRLSSRLLDLRRKQTRGLMESVNACDLQNYVSYKYILSSFNMYIFNPQLFSTSSPWWFPTPRALCT
jgi:hypothetical protein